MFWVSDWTNCFSRMNNFFKSWNETICLITWILMENIIRIILVDTFLIFSSSFLFLLVVYRIVKSELMRETRSVTNLCSAPCFQLRSKGVSISSGMVPGLPVIGQLIQIQRSPWLRLIHKSKSFDAKISLFEICIFNGSCVDIERTD